MAPRTDLSVDIKLKYKLQAKLNLCYYYPADIWGQFLLWCPAFFQISRTLRPLGRLLRRSSTVPFLRFICNIMNNWYFIDFKACIVLYSANTCIYIARRIKMKEQFSSIRLPCFSFYLPWISLLIFRKRSGLWWVMCNHQIKFFTNFYLLFQPVVASRNPRNIHMGGWYHIGCDIWFGWHHFSGSSGMHSRFTVIDYFFIEWYTDLPLLDTVEPPSITSSCPNNHGINVVGWVIMFINWCYHVL